MLLQYARRRTIASRVILVTGLLILAAAPGLNLWHAAFQMQGGSGSPQADPIRITMDNTRDIAPGRGVLGRWHGSESYVRIVLPVQVTGVPTGGALLSERIAARLESADGASWSGPWSDAGGTLHLQGEQRLLPEDGAYWQYFYVDRAVFDRLKNTPVHVRTSAAFTLLSAPTTTRITPPTLAQFVPRFGFCATRAIGAGLSNMINEAVSAICLAPFQEPEWFALYVQSRRTGGSRALEADSRFPTVRIRWNLAAGTWSMVGDVKPVYNPPDLDVLLESRQAVAHFERGLDLPALRLIQYEDSPKEDRL